MSYIDELRNTPKDTPLTPAEKERQQLPHVCILTDNIKEICMIEQKSGNRQFQGMFSRLLWKVSDNDGGYIDTHAEYVFRPEIVGKQKLTEYAVGLAQRTSFQLKSLSETREFTYSAMDVADAMYNSANVSPVYFKYKETAIRMRDELRDEIEKLGFSRNSVVAIEISDFRIKVKVKSWKNIWTNEIKFQRDVSPIEFTGGSIYGLKIDLKW